MKRTLLVVLLGLMLLFSFGCGSPKHYTIYAKDGKQYSALGAPKYSGDMVTFEDLDGRKVTFPKAEVEKVIEHVK